jgi:hypothetical protein
MERPDLVCSDCGMPAYKAWVKGGLEDRQGLMLYCKRHPPPLWITLNEEWKEIDIRLIRVLQVMHG